MTSEDFNTLLQSKSCIVWILAPYLDTDDPNLAYYYDFKQSIEEYTRVFKTLDIPWKWQAVSIHNFRSIISDIRMVSDNLTPIVLNLCDGDEINDVPGISVIDALEAEQLMYTGSNRHFYHITTSKLDMKRAFEEANVSTAPWKLIDLENYRSISLFETLSAPVIIKPCVSAGSMGIGVKSVVSTDEEFYAYMDEIKDGYRGWNLAEGGFIAESFIKGPEYTSLIVGSTNHPSEITVHLPVERLFDKQLPEEQKFLSFDRLWEIYEEEKPLEDNAFLWQYHLPEQQHIEHIKAVSLEAYKAVGGTGYGRVDIRMDSATGKLYVLEVNAQCGLSEDEDYTSIGAILRYAGISYSQLIKEILLDAYARHYHRKQITAEISI